jgi:hypothetical protein
MPVMKDSNEQVKPSHYIDPVTEAYKKHIVRISSLVSSGEPSALRSVDI